MNRSSKIFLGASSVYLSLLSILLVMHPKSGYSPDIEKIIARLLFLIIPLSIVIILIKWGRKRLNSSNVLDGFSEARGLALLIGLLVLIGFAFNLDFCRQSGCFIENEAMLSTRKFLYSGGSLMLLAIGYANRTKRIGRVILIIEFFLWTSKSLYYNSSLDLFTTAYFTLTSWMLRVTLITKLMNLDHLGPKLNSKIEPR